jgi:outer membrane protein
LKNWIKVACLGAVLSASSLYATAAEAAQKVGYINTARVFQSLPQREVALQNMQKEFKDRAAELESIKADIKAKAEKLNRDQSLLSADDVEKAKVEIAQLQSNYKIKAKALEQASSRREAEEKGKLFKLIHDAVKKVAEKEHYDMIVDIQVLQYANPDLDVSEKVMNELK